MNRRLRIKDRDFNPDYLRVTGVKMRTHVQSRSKIPRSGGAVKERVMTLEIVSVGKPDKNTRLITRAALNKEAS